eukprot:TRINITY_DN3164_c0_g1_i1.p1 TRINITY_DN3164_c0_g1~~TRINITY_DN3164_c0_g1_i1.p1  ORF type:complete len:367 (-),score=91.60 TRINITY_DN3164_c0_g1_i1:28-1104(-)
MEGLLAAVRQLLVEAAIIYEDDPELSLDQIPEKLTELTEQLPEMRSAKRMVGRMRMENSEQLSIIEEQKEQIESLQREFEGLNEIQSDYELQIANLEQAKALQALTLEREFMSQQEQSRGLLEENRFLQNDITNLQRQLEESKRTISQLQQDDARMKREVEAHKVRISTLEGHLRKLNSSVMDMKRERKATEQNEVLAKQEAEETRRLLEDAEEERKRNELMAKQLNKEAMIQNKLTTVATQEAFKEGWILKKSQSGPKFQKRWLVVKGNSMQYYKSDTDDKTKPQGTYFIEQMRCYRNPETTYGEINVFELHFDNITDKKKKVVVLSAASEDEKKSWCKTIQSAAAQSATRKATGAN